MLTVTLNAQELRILHRQHVSTKSQGGWQGLLVTLREKVNPATRDLTLSFRDIERIHRYAFDYGNGGWENRLRDIFQRTLGPTLGAQYLSGKAA